MKVMISINPPYTDMIFNGYKPYEFRKRVLNGMDDGYPVEDITAYIYETKNKGGNGKVIGEVKIAGTYTLNYANHTQDTPELVKERFNFIKMLYFQWCEMNNIIPNMKEGWFKSKKFKQYQKEIGFISLNFNYALILDKPIKYENPRSLSNFNNSKGEQLTRPPQNMFHVSIK